MVDISTKIVTEAPKFKLDENGYALKNAEATLVDKIFLQEYY